MPTAHLISQPTLTASPQGEALGATAPVHRLDVQIPIQAIGFKQQSRKTHKRKDMSFRARLCRVEKSTHFVSFCSEIGAKILRLAGARSG